MALRSRYSAAEAAFVDADAKLQRHLLEPTSTQTRKADLPFERPTKFYLKTNTRVAKSWGHRVAPSVFARADETALLTLSRHRLDRNPRRSKQLT